MISVGRLRLMDTQDKILHTVLDIQVDLKDVKDRLQSIEKRQSQTFDKIDGFLVLINRYETEIAALRLGQQRLTDRLELLEKQYT